MNSQWRENCRHFFRVRTILTMAVGGKLNELQIKISMQLAGIEYWKMGKIEHKYPGLYRISY